MRVPEGWRSVRLGDVARESRLRNDGSAIGGERLYGVFKDKGMVPMRDRVRGASVERCKVVKPGAFAYNPMRLNIGSVACWYGNDDAIVSPDYVVFECDPSQLDHRYLDCLRKGRDWGKFVGNSGDGGVRVRIYFNHLAEFQFLLPPLSEQRRIVEALSSIDDAIVATQEVIEQFGRVKQSVLKLLLTKGVGHGRFKETRIGFMPESWEVRRIDELGEVLSGRQRSPHFTDGESHPYLRVANVFDGYIDDSDVLCMNFSSDEFERYRLRRGDILLNEGQSIELVGRNAMYGGVPADCCFQNTLIRFRARCGVYNRFAYALMQHLFLEGKFSKIATQTTSVAHLGSRRFAALLVGLPPIEEQKRIASIHDAMVVSERSEAARFCRLLRLRMGLLSNLLSGRKRVFAGTLSPAA